jgi:hypothetical protein
MNFKRIIILLTAASALLGESPQLHPELRLSVFNLFNSGIQIQFEKPIAERIAMVTMGELIYREDSDEAQYGFSGELQSRFYFDSSKRGENEQITEKFYLAPSLRYINRSFEGLEDYSYHDKVQRIGLAFLTGMKFSHENRMVIDASAGALLIKSFFKTEYRESNYRNGIFSVGYSGIQLTMGLSIGLWL